LETANFQGTFIHELTEENQWITYVQLDDFDKGEPRLYIAGPETGYDLFDEISKLHQQAGEFQRNVANLKDLKISIEAPASAIKND
jgi:hypothetical protein